MASDVVDANGGATGDATMAAALGGRVIALPETRELDIFAALLERRGASVLRYPLVSILDAPDPEPVLAWLEAFCAGGCDDLVLLTGEGLRRLLRRIELNPGRLTRAAFVAALGRVRRFTRGPKPARALRELGLRPDVEVSPPTTAGVIAALQGLPLAGRRVGVQLYGADPNTPLMDYLRAAGAMAVPVAPYVYGDAVADPAVQELLQRLQRGGVDAIAFTSRPQVERLFRSAPADEVRAALARTRVAAVGPVVADTLATHGVAIETMPEDSWFLKPLTVALVALLNPAADAAAGSDAG
ncbi:MAG: uroporphyrinogen-III synthase [Steroidobacteraceae bacterium]